MKNFEQCVQEAAELAIQEHQLEVQLDEVRDKQREVFKTLNKKFKINKELDYMFGDRKVHLHFSLSMYGEHACQIDVHDGEKRVGLTWLH